MWRASRLCGAGRADLPSDPGNTLRGVHDAAPVALTRASDPLARCYSLFRSEVRTAWPAPLRTLLPGPADTLPDLAAPPLLYDYRSAGASCSGREAP